MRNMDPIHITDILPFQDVIEDENSTRRRGRMIDRETCALDDGDGEVSIKFRGVLIARYWRIPGSGRWMLTIFDNSASKASALRLDALVSAHTKSLYRVVGCKRERILIGLRTATGYIERPMRSSTETYTEVI